MKKFTKITLIVASFVLVAALSVAGTLAWLTDSTTVVTNTFAPTDITIDLKEHDYSYDPTEKPVDLENPIGKLGSGEVTTENDYNMIPGATLPKDPFLRVNAKSEACYIFVEVVEKNNNNTLTTDETDKIIDYTIDPIWKELSGVSGKVNGGKVYYYVGSNPAVDTGKVVEYSETNQTFNILKDQIVSVSNTLTNTYMDGIDTDAEKPALEFYGYAVQALGFANATVAWAEAPAPETGA